MIRARKIELSNIKNVHLGSIEFRDSDSGSCIAGIYGQNGSGKTAVVDAFSCLKLLMCGRSLTAGAEELIGPVSVQTEIAVEFEIQQGAARALGLPTDAESAIAGGKSFFRNTVSLSGNEKAGSSFVRINCAESRGLAKTHSYCL